MGAVTLTADIECWQSAIDCGATTGANKSIRATGRVS